MPLQILKIVSFKHNYQYNYTSSLIVLIVHTVISYQCANLVINISPTGQSLTIGSRAPPTMELVCVLAFILPYNKAAFSKEGHQCSAYYK